MFESPFEARYMDALLQDLAQPPGEFEREWSKDRVTAVEVGYRAWSHAQDCDPYEANSLDEIRDYIPVAGQAFGDGGP